MEVVLLQGAEADVQAAFEFLGGLEGRCAGLFLHRLDHLFGLLESNPALGSPYGGPFRRLLVRGFHHGIFYTLTGDRLFVAAVLDLRQDPARLRQRLGL